MGSLTSGTKAHWNTPRTSRVAWSIATWLAVSELVWVGGCLDREPILGPAINDTTTIVLAPIVSNPVPAAAATRAGASLSVGGTSSTDVVYVSLPPGTIPNGGLATIRNTRTGAEVLAAMAAGGFDPVPIEARVGDTLALDVDLIGGRDSSLVLPVPAARPPVVVRTEPPPRKRDVPLNASVVVVFSEPIDPSTVGGIRLLRDGAAVGGHIVLSADGLRGTFQPDQLLAAGADYVLSISTDVTDLSGDRLEQPVRVEFTTGSTVAAAWIVTEQSALFTNPFNGELRTFEMSAIRHGDGQVTGYFNTFYPGPGWLSSGRVTCFTIVDDTTAWVAGVTETAADPSNVGLERGWRIVDHGVSAGGVPDELSLNHALEPGGLGSAQQFCATTPTNDPIDGEIVLNTLLSGDIAIASGDSGGPPPPPPPPSDMSQIAFSYGGIKVVDADGSGVRTLTTNPGDGSPAWSPAGTKLAFQSDREGTLDIYVMNYDGSGISRLTTDSSYDSDPAWSPDGARIAFNRDGAIYIMDAADGSGVTKLIDAGWGSHPAWSPDGLRIAFSREEYPNSHIYVVNVDGSGLSQLTNGPVYDYAPAWSRDGARIAFARAVDQDGGPGLHVMNADGSGVTRLTIGINGPPSWSPDSRAIVFEWYGLFIVNWDGSGLTRLATGFTPAWSPVGTMPPRPEPYLSVSAVSGDAQIDTVLATLADPLQVLVHRDGGTPVPGVTVSWIAHLQGAVLSSDRTVTNSLGIASVTLTFGSLARTGTVQAAVTDGTARSALPVSFTATARAGRPVALEGYAAGGPIGAVGSTLEHSVYALDGHGIQNSGCPRTWCGNFVSGVQVNWAVSAGGGTITPTEDTTAITPLNSVTPLSRAVHTLGPNEGIETVTATAPTISGAPQVTFGATVVTIVVVVNYGFSPDSVVVQSGRTVGWFWPYSPYSEDEHDVTFEDDPTAGSGTLQNTGVYFTRTFTGRPRMIRYRCTLHSTSFTEGEVGTVTVQ